MYEITKDFSFCYGHRVWSQELDRSLALDSKCVCRHLHGHEALVTVTLRSELLRKGMVTDFKHTNWLKQWFDDKIDHKFILDINDPFYPLIITNFLANLGYEGSMVWDEYYEMGSISLPDASSTVSEYLDSFVFVTFVPTSENLAAWISTIVKKRMYKVAIVSSVTWKETSKTSATFTA